MVSVFTRLFKLREERCETTYVSKLQEFRKDIFDLRDTVSNLSKNMDEIKSYTNQLADRIEKLTLLVNNIAREVSKLSDSIGFIIEDSARSFLPAWIYKYLNIEVEKLDRRFFNINGKILEFDYYGEGWRIPDKSKIIIIGEAKSRIHAEDVKLFYEKTMMLVEMNKIKDPLMIMYGLYIHPSAENEAKGKNIIIITPYQTLIDNLSNINEVSKIIQNKCNT
ncbi:MAG: hypothetical protein QXP02_03865 [Desulfurococcaceae archaeon]